MDAVEKCSKLMRLEEEIVDLESEESRYAELAKDYRKRAVGKINELRELIRAKDDGQTSIPLDGEPSEDEAPVGMPED